VSASGPAHVIGRYALFGEIASGGMAKVYFGRLMGPVGFSRTVAIKRLQPHFASDPEFAAMFLDEARLAARVRHPNVIPTLDVVATQGELFLVMEYVQGESLAKLVRSCADRGESVPVRIAASIMSGALLGLQAAHDAHDEHGTPLGLVHRDVSPQNILVGADGVPRVLDFGVAKALGRTQSTREGQVKGKLSYMAPEQFHGEAVTRQADIYAAAVVLWEALTGRRLFSGDNEAIVLARIVKHEVVPPSRYRSEVSHELDRVVLKGIASKPAHRYASARDMALALEKSVGPVSTIEVSEWVEQVAGAQLSDRAQQIASIERSSMSSSIPGLPPGGGAPAGAQPTLEVDDTQLGAPPVASAPPTAVTKRSALESSASPESTATANVSVATAPLARALRSRVRRTRMTVAGVGLGLFALVSLAIVASRKAPVPPVHAPSATSAHAGEPVVPPPPSPSAASSVAAPTASITANAAPTASAAAATSSVPGRGRAPRPASTKEASPFKAIGGRE
jgi:serine/threonine protein kinase